MDAAVRIRAARWADKDPVATLIAAALHPTPLAAWLVPDPALRRRVLTEVLAIWVEHAMFYGDSHVTDDLMAATVGFHRYRPIPPPANYRHRLTDAAGPHADRFDLLDTLLSEPRPSEPHYHLAFLAVHPDARGTGRATAILTHHRRRLDRIDLPSWTDTTTDAHTLYTRHGYTPRPPIPLPDGPALQPMRRNPDRRLDTWPSSLARPAAPLPDHSLPTTGRQ
ncbi:GNAT family N-acetyltransferase [Micromonospora thermarum]|uniref:GNAT family N-acetyltransferase n=1 Tax=Micromonospora thermarum TaxID=2720024 RepID=A0ABX0YZB9_9ACTN|nr:GNAT family N-acetyltransferase [Micromonospora thermarum]NJP30598.1 GNAT family N-acetyltransferase [Micromonospora thermarum]